MKKSYLGITIDMSRDELLDEQGLKLLKEFYCTGDETSPQQSFARAATSYCFGDYDFAQRIYDYVSQKWFMFASPVLSNASSINWKKAPQKYNFKEKGTHNNDMEAWLHRNLVEKTKGLPISCFLSFVPDTLEGLIEHTTELRWLSVKGGGVGGHWSDVRSVSKMAPGPIPFIKTVDSDMSAYMQGKVRRGSYAAYLDIDHPDIQEFITIRMPTGGDFNRKCLNLNNGVNITDKFLDAVLNDSSWDLIDPKEKNVRSTHNARELWQQILEIRNQTGEPYLHFISESNRHLPQYQQDMGLKVNGSNLCTEITLATDINRTAVCCLSSTNLEYFDDWKDTDMIKDLVRLLDNVLEYFIICCPIELEKARNSAESERSIGLGAMGFHSYLQKNNVAWESAIAKSMNMRVFKHIRKEADAANVLLTDERGPNLDSLGTDKPVRLAHLIAIAPNANSGMIVGTSPSVEPSSSNAYVHDSRVGSYLIKNRWLEAVINKYATDNTKDSEWIEEQWKSVINAMGSVQHLEWMDDYTKEVFKTAYEIHQFWVVDHGRDRQEWIDQAQSINTFFPKNPDKAYVNQVHLRAFLPANVAGGQPLKSLYYFRTKALKNADTVSQKIERLALKDGVVEGVECMACQG